MKLKAVIIGATITGFAGAALAHDAPSCQQTRYAQTDYTICKFDPQHDDIRQFLRGEDGEILGSFEAVNAQLAKSGEKLAFAMNGGMYHKDRAPVGLYRQGGETMAKIQTKASSGNFGLLPNGVFYNHQGTFGVSETKAFMQKSVFPDNATQSGPMLVTEGELHPKFTKGSASKKIRNGVGQTKTGEIVFVKSDTPVNFYDFASLFKNQLKTPNALYLDGVISRVYSAELGRSDFGAKMGPIIGVVVPDVKSEAQYIANEAVLITHGDSKIMFDPLPLSGFGVYPETPKTDIAKMMKGEGAYAGVDAVFISHAHRDHFSSAKMIAYMTNNPDVRLVAPKQALEMMQADETWDETLQSRMTIIDMEAGDAAKDITIGDIKASAVRIPHAGWPAPKRAAVQNMVYRVTLKDEKNGEGATVIHMGDADPRRQHFIPHKDHWEAKRTDSAFPPYWFLTSAAGRYILENEMNVAKSIAIHVPLEVPEDLKHSGEDYFSVSGETRELGE